MRTDHSTSWALTITTAVVLLVAACSSSDEDDVASAATTVQTTARATAGIDGEDGSAAIVYRDLTAYEIGLCWRNEDGSIGFPVGAAVPGPDATIGTVHLYVPFDLAGTRLTDVATFTRCSLEPM